MSEKPKAVVLLSGGMDSCVTTAIANQNVPAGAVACELWAANGEAGAASV